MGVFHPGDRRFRSGFRIRDVSDIRMRETEEEKDILPTNVAILCLLPGPLT